MINGKVVFNPVNPSGEYHDQDSQREGVGDIRPLKRYLSLLFVPDHAGRLELASLATFNYRKTHGWWWERRGLTERGGIAEEKELTFPGKLDVIRLWAERAVETFDCVVEIVPKQHQVIYGVADLSTRYLEINFSGLSAEYGPHEAFKELELLLDRLSA